MNCCCSYAGTSVCYHCMNRPLEWSKPVYVINPPFTVDSTNFPPQEFVPIVRCRDCKQFRKKGEDYGCCLEGYGNVDGNHYCSYGERREDDEID